MKHPLITLALCIVLHTAIAQTTPASSREVGFIDVLKDSSVTLNSRVRKGQYYVRIINMNPLIYKSKDSVNLVLPPEDEVNATVFESLHEALLKTTASESPEVPDPASKSMSFMKTEAKKLKKTPAEEKAEAFEKAFGDYRSSVTKFKGVLKDIGELSSFCNAIVSICKDASASQSDIQASLSNDAVITGYFNSPSGMNGEIPSKLSVSRKATTLIADLKNTYNECVSNHGKMKKLYSELRIISTTIQTALIEVMDETDASIGQAKTTFEKVNQDALTKLASGAGTAFSVIHKQDSFTEYVRVNVGDGNSADVVIDIISNDATLAEDQRHTFSLCIGGGFRTFTAPGLMINFLGARDEKYYLDKDGIVREGEQENAAIPSLSVMQVFYFRKCTNNFWAGTIGLSANFADLTSINDLRIFAGPAYVIGDNTKVVITAGITGGYAEGLKGYFKKDTEADPEILEQENNKLTDRFFRFGVYAGVAIKVFKK